jgi:peptidoglycan/LPS O-acetylase OafA/YrhL
VEKQRVEFLDAMRGIAIAMVIVNHAGSITGLTGWLRHFTGLMSYGVQMFFVISAYTIFMTYAASLNKGAATPARDFLIRRLFRIVPVYWMGIVLYTVVYGMESRGWLPGPELWHFPLHIFLLNIWHPDVQSSVVPGGWSISVEVMFYLIVPLCFTLVRDVKQAMAFTAIAMVAGPLAVGAFAHAIAPQLADMSPVLLKHWWERNPLNQLGCFGVGIFLYFAVKAGWHKRFEHWRPNVGLMLFAAALVIAGDSSRIAFPQSQHLFALAFGAFGLALAAIPWRVIVNQCSVFLGRISYSGYLLHFLVLKQLTLVFPGEPGAGYFLAIVGSAFVLTIPLAYLSYVWIEQPSIGLGKKLIVSLSKPRLEPVPGRGPGGTGF